MAWDKQRQSFRAILDGDTCVNPASVHDPVSARIAEDIGYELGMLAGSVASLSILGDPDLILVTVTELAESVRRITRASGIPLLVDADHGFGNALNVRRTVQELEHAGAAGLTIEDTVLPRAFGQTGTQFVSLSEHVGKLRAAVQARTDPALVLIGRTGATVGGADDAVARAKAYESTGIDALFFTALKTGSDLSAVASSTRLPIILGGAVGEIGDNAALARNRVRVRLLGHQPFAAAALATYETLKALRDGTKPKDLKGLPSADFVNRTMRHDIMQRYIAEFLK